MKVFLLDKIIKQGTEYETPKRVALKITKIGTDASSASYLKIDGKVTGNLLTTFAPLHKTSSNKLGPIDLGDLFLVVPPETKFKIEGASGAKFRIIGQYIILDPGESLPDELERRFDNQFNHYLTYVTGTKTLSTDAAWPAGTEYEVISLTPKTIEKYLFNNLMLAAISGDSVAEGDFAIKLYRDGNPFQNILVTNLQEGIDILSAPSPPKDTTEETPFTFKNFPFEIPGDVTLSVKVKNTSGSSKSPASGSAWSVTIILVCDYYKKP